MASVLHLIVAGIRPDTPASALTTAEALAQALTAVPGVSGVLRARAPHALVIAVMLDHQDRLEGFAASPEHMALVMRGIAQVTDGMWSASVTAEVAPDTLTRAAARSTRLWALALADNDALFEWQARALLDGIATLPGTGIAGLTVEERERFRAAGVVLLAADQVAGFASALEAARAAWADLAPLIREVDADVVPIGGEVPR